MAKLDCGPVNTLEQYEQTLKEDSETQCAAEVLEPQEEEVRSGVPNIDWDTAIGNHHMIIILKLEITIPYLPSCYANIK